MLKRSKLICWYVLFSYDASLNKVESNGVIYYDARCTIITIRYEHACKLLEAHKSHILKRLAALQSQDQSPVSVDKQEVNVTVIEMSVCIHSFLA